MASEAAELHDSELLAVRSDGLGAVLELTLYVHSSQGASGRDPGTGSMQKGDLLLEGAAIVATPATYPLWILDGSVRVGGVAFDNLLPIPFDRSGEVAVRLSGAEGTFAASARRAQLTLVGPRVFVEDFKL